ncbi:unnamed protein product [Mytilus edulis]|uniref:Uncharacterized protein n=1 Tax=Mytilus edulis TaxID=6550 RepID=A0A8S3R252_MYTED|nr:unnamed protein product [Mytilus edulis]
MEQSIKDMKSNLERIADDRGKNLKHIHQQRQRFLTDIKEIREKINKHLDKLEQEIEQNIQAAEQKAISQIDTVLSKTSGHCKTIDKLQKNISATKHLATDLQTFLGGKMFEAEIQKEEKFMQSLIEDVDLQQINLQCKIDDKLSKILSLTKMGEISVTANPPTITITMDREKQAQQMIPTIPKTINDINLTLLTRFEISKGRTGLEISGCTILPSRKMVFVDRSNHSLVIHNENGVFESEILVLQCPVDVTGIDENTVAVTHNSEPYHIKVIDFANKKVVKKIKTSSICYGITNTEGRLIFYTFGSGIQAVDVTDESIVTTVVNDYEYSFWNYVTSSKDKIYRTDLYDRTVTCYTVTGQKVWEYEDETMLKWIRGVTDDNDSNVYIVSNNSVDVLSPDGKKVRQLLGNEMGLNTHVLRMASASGPLCGVCETQDVVMDAIFWCPECDEAIGEIIKTSKTSALFDIMEQSIKDMKSNLERIADDRGKNLEDIHQQRQRFLTDIKEIREKINKHLDKLEQEIQQNIQAAEQKPNHK